MGVMVAPNVFSDMVWARATHKVGMLAPKASKCLENRVTFSSKINCGKLLPLNTHVFSIDGGIAFRRDMTPKLALHSKNVSVSAKEENLSRHSSYTDRSVQRNPIVL